MPNERYAKLDPITGEPVWQEGKSGSAGAGDAGKLIARGDDGLIAASDLPTGVGAAVITGEATENLGAGQWVNIWFDSSNREVRLADADNNRPAHGFVKEAVTAAATATVYPLGEINDQLSGLTAGTVYFLSATAGGQTTDVSGYTDGDLIQRLGVAISTTAIKSEDRQAIPLADA